MFDAHSICEDFYFLLFRCYLARCLNIQDVNNEIRTLILWHRWNCSILDFFRFDHLDLFIKRSRVECLLILKLAFKSVTFCFPWCFHIVCGYTTPEPAATTSPAAATIPPITTGSSLTTGTQFENLSHNQPQHVAIYMHSFKIVCEAIYSLVKRLSRSKLINVLFQSLHDWGAYVKWHCYILYCIVYGCASE